MRRAPFIFGFVSIVLGVLLTVIGFQVELGFTITGLAMSLKYLQVGGAAMILGGLVIALQGAVAKTP